MAGAHLHAGLVQVLIFQLPLEVCKLSLSPPHEAPPLPQGMRLTQVGTSRLGAGGKLEVLEGGQRQGSSLRVTLGRERAKSLQSQEKPVPGGLGALAAGRCMGAPMLSLKHITPTAALRTPGSQAGLH